MKLQELLVSLLIDCDKINDSCLTEIFEVKKREQETTKMKERNETGNFYRALSASQ